MLMPERCFYGFADDFFFAVPLSRKRKAVSDRPIHKWNKPLCTAGKPGRMILYVRPDTLGQTYKIILPCRWFARFHASGYVPFFPFGDFFFSQISLLKFSCLICLHFRLPPFSRLSVTPHQAVISVLGAKVIPGLDGNARSSLLFSAKISSPAGSILTEKPCIPYQKQRRYDGNGKFQTNGAIHRACDMRLDGAHRLRGVRHPLGHH